MSFAPGDKIGPYEILEPLGAGGMGQVWKARDSRLNRTVAIKTSNKRFSERFEREAHAIAALNHPHICTLYDVGPDYLVMEHVEGKPLAGPMPVDQALKVAEQILDALDAAHRKGIVHRDLKPGNILLGPNGVKVLDFGLAKFDRTSENSDATLTMQLTGEGSILGTLQYMAPEQLEGREADARSDIFSFGLLLYELITGQRAFTGKSQASLIAAILKEPARPVSELQPLTPHGLDRVLQTCLEKDPEKRWQSAREIKHAMEWTRQDATASLSGVLPAPHPPKKSKFGLIAAAGVAVLVLAAAGWTFWPKSEPVGQVRRFQVEMPADVTFSQYVSVSPDGRKLVFNATGQKSGLWIRDLDSLEWRQLAGTENGVSPSWSPDSKFLTFGQGTQLRKIDVGGGPAQTLADFASTPVGSSTWNNEGVLLFGGRGRGGLMKVSQAGGVPAPVTEVDASRKEAFHGLPQCLPDGKHFLYLRNGAPEILGTYIGSLDTPPKDQSKERLFAGGQVATYSDGYLFFMRENTLMAQPFDTAKLTLTGEPVPVAEQVAVTQSIGVFSASPSGVLAYRTGALGGQLDVTWLDASGKKTGAFTQSTQDRGIRLSPDGGRGVARDAGQANLGDLWTLDFARGVRTRLTFRQSLGSFGAWSPDGSKIAFAAGDQLDTVFEKSASGAGEERELLKEPGVIHLPFDYSRDGKFLLYHTGNFGGALLGQYILPLDGSKKPVTLLNNPQYGQGEGRLSPDMHWLVYSSAESGRLEVYVRPFNASGPSLGDGKWQISRDGGSLPRWRGDGKELYFRSAGGIMTVSVKANGAAFEAGIPEQLFALPQENGWDVTADGKRFIASVPNTPQTGQTPITVILNWQQQLKKK